MRHGVFDVNPRLRYRPDSRTTIRGPEEELVPKKVSSLPIELRVFVPIFALALLIAVVLISTKSHAKEHFPHYVAMTSFMGYSLFPERAASILTYGPARERFFRVFRDAYPHASVLYVEAVPIGNNMFDIHVEWFDER